MIIGDRLKRLREERNISQGDLEKRTGLARCHISRLENSHTVPSIGTLEIMARALEVALYEFFYEGEQPLQKGKTPGRSPFGRSRRDAVYLYKLTECLSRTADADRELLLDIARKIVSIRKHAT